MIRGVERRRIFDGDDDRGAFVDRFERLVCELGFRCDALALLPNHVHAVLRTGATPLAVLMHRLSFLHAQRFNRANARRGHLFEDRYKARRVGDEGDLVRVIAYVLGNPMRHRVVDGIEALFADPWSMLSALAGRRPPRRFESATRLAQLLGADPRSAIRAVALRGELRDAALEPEPLAELERLIGEMCTRHGIPRERLRGRAQRGLRGELVVAAVRSLGIPVTQASRAIGVSRSWAQRALATAPK